MSETGGRNILSKVKNILRRPEKRARRSWRREAAEWAVILAVFFLLYISGLHTTVIGTLQGVMLQTGFFRMGHLEEPVQIQGDLLLADLDGRPAGRLSEMRGKAVFINIWATWCPPCVAEMPDLQRLYDRVQDPALSYIFLSSDRDPETVKRFLEKKDLDLPVYFPLSPLPSELESRVIPSSYLVDAQGRIVMRRHGMAKYNSRSFRRELRQLINADGETDQ